MKKAFFLFIIVIVSCTSNNHIDLEPHETKLLVVDPSKLAIMDDSEYDIIDVVSLDLPKGISTIIPKDIQIVNDYIYILDEEINKTVFLYDMDGKLIGQMGRVGHARNEYTNKPECLSIDDKTGIAYVYDRGSRRILKFDSTGKYLESVTLEKFVPGCFVVTDSQNYICCFEDGNNASDDGNNPIGSQLSLYDKDGEHIKAFLPSPENHKLSLIGKPIYKNKGKISCVPYLADSIVVFSGDELDYTIKSDFCGQFVSEEIKKKSMEEGTFSYIYKHKGVQFIDQFELTDSILHIGYAYNLSRSHFVKNRKNGKTYNTTFGPLFRGYCPVCDFFVTNDKLVYYIEEEDVNKLLVKNAEMNNPSEVLKHRKASSPKMLDIMDKKYNFPLIMMVKLK